MVAIGHQSIKRGEMSALLVALNWQLAREDSNGYERKTRLRHRKGKPVK
jgi:hypothetical protein